MQERSVQGTDFYGSRGTRGRIVPTRYAVFSDKEPTNGSTDARTSTPHHSTPATNPSTHPDLIKVDGVDVPAPKAHSHERQARRSRYEGLGDILGGMMRTGSIAYVTRHR